MQLECSSMWQLASSSMWQGHREGVVWLMSAVLQRVCSSKVRGCEGAGVVWLEAAGMQRACSSVWQGHGKGCRGKQCRADAAAVTTC
jgi:hypothetical protein